jgi:hypothetical protein
MDYTPNIDAQGMRRPMGPVDQPNWNGGPKLIHNPQVMNNQTVGQPNLANAMANQRPIIPIRGRIVTSEQDIVPAEIPMDGSICLFMTEDCKKVIAKQWNSNGVLQSIIYSISSNEQAQSECQNGDMDQNEPKMMNKPVSTYGAAYDSWSDARKHYTKTGSSEDKERMEERGKEHVEKAIISMRDIWSEASPELKRAMKTELSTLVDNMTI